MSDMQERDEATEFQAPSQGAATTDERADSDGARMGDSAPATDGPTGSADAGEGSDALSELRAELDAANGRIEALSAEATDLKDQLLRRQAEFENVRRRIARERDDAVAYANQQLLLDLTSVIDDFQRAIRSAEESRDYDAFHNGVVLIEKQLTSMLERKWGLTPFDSEGQDFDPQRHEAVTAEAREGTEQSIVLEDYQKGYLLNDRVLRSAKVKVSTPAGGAG